MKSKLAKKLCCADCGGEIEVEKIVKSEGKQILAGSLVRKECHECYRVFEKWGGKQLVH